MNFIRHILQPKMKIIWRLFVENLHTLRRFDFLIITLLLLTLMEGYLLAGKTFSPVIGQKSSTPPMTRAIDPVKAYSSPQLFLSGQFQLSAQSQISPTVESYPAPLSPTSYPAPPPATAEVTESSIDEIEELYPEPDSREQPLLTYPSPSTGQNPGINQTSPSQDPSAPPSIGSNSSRNQDQGNQDLAQTSPAVSVTILWIGFLASLIIFLSAILWSILTYSRQRNSER